MWKMKKTCHAEYLFLVLATILVQIWTVHTGQIGCLFRYAVVPGPTSETCNIIGSSVNTSCQISGGRMFGLIQWHFTKNRDLIGQVNDSLINNSSSLYSFELTAVVRNNATNSFHVQTSTLIISKLDNSTTGYYWCSVQDASGTVQPTPSHVLHIRAQCSIEDIDSCGENTPLNSYLPSDGELLCANQALRNDSIKIVDAQDISCTTFPQTTMSSVTATKTTEFSPTKTATTIPEDKKATTSKPTFVSETESNGTDHTPTVFVSTTNQEQRTDEENQTDESLGTSSLPIDVIWLAIGVILAILLCGVIILLTIISCLQCSKRKMKGKSRETDTHSNIGENAVELREPANEYVREANMEWKPEPDYAEITANRGTPNPLFFNKDSLDRQTSLRDDSVALSPDSLQYEDVILPVRQPRPSQTQYENMSEDPPDYSRLVHSDSVKQSDQPSTSSVPSTSFSPPGARLEERNPLEDSVFDDPMYATVDALPPSSNPHTKVFKSRSANVNSGEDYSHLDLGLPSGAAIPIKPGSQTLPGESYHQPLTAFTKHVPPSIVRRKSYDSSSSRTHTYTPIQHNSPKQKNNYTFPIVVTDEKYVSEQGHMYHVLESAANNPKLPKPKIMNIAEEDTPTELSSKPSDIPIVDNSDAPVDEGHPTKLIVAPKLLGVESVSQSEP